RCVTPKPSANLPNQSDRPPRGRFNFRSSLAEIQGREQARYNGGAMPEDKFTRALKNANEIEITVIGRASAILPRGTETLFATSRIWRSGSAKNLRVENDVLDGEIACVDEYG